MTIFDVASDLIPLSIAAVAFFIVLKSMDKYPEAPLGTEFIYGGFFLVLLNRAVFMHIGADSFFLLSTSLTVHFVGIASIITGGIKFKIKYYKPIPLLIVVSIVGAVGSYFVVFFFKDRGFADTLYFGSLAAGLAVLGGSFLLRPKMEKTGGYFVSAFASIGMAVCYILKASDIGNQILATAHFEIIFIVLLLFGLVMMNGNIMWSQLEFLLSDVKTSKERLRLIIQASPFPIVISRLRDDTLMLVNNRAAETFGLDVRHPETFKTADYFADASNRKDLLAVLEKQPIIENFEANLRKTNSTETFWMLISCRIIDFEQDIALYTAFQDITGIKEKEMKLFDQATRDPLTNCYNRRQFEELSKKEIYKSSRTNSPFTIAMIDADHFKKVNDTYGHATGDIVLKELAECCRKTLRESDIIARFGGEEFVLLLPETSAALAYTVCDRLRGNIANLEVRGINDELVKFTVSIGLAESSIGSDINSLIEVADEALYVAKQTGRNRVVLGEKDMNAKTIIEEQVVIPTAPAAGLVVDETAPTEQESKDEVPLPEEKFVAKKSIWDMD